MWFLLFKVLKYLGIAALVQTYISIGPGGEAVQAIVQSMTEQFMQIDWKSILSSVLEHGKEWLNSLVEWLNANPDIQSQAKDAAESVKQAEQAATK